ATADRGDHPLDLRIARTSGHAVQTGSILTVTVNRPRTNIVQITNVGAGNVVVGWNGGAAHSFTDVTTIIVDTHNARKDQVTLTPAALGSGRAPRVPSLSPAPVGVPASAGLFRLKARLQPIKPKLRAHEPLLPHAAIGRFEVARQPVGVRQRRTTHALP